MDRTMQKSPLVFKLIFSLGGFSCDHCSGWLFISRPLGSLSGCTWHSQGPLFNDPHLRFAQNIQHFAFPWWRFFATKGRIMSLNAQRLYVYETFFSSSYQSPQLWNYERCRKREGSGYFDSLVGCFLLFVFVLILNHREHECRQREGGLVNQIYSNIFCAFVFTLYFCVFVCALYHHQSEGA